jgi:hypothetical protein
MTTDSTNTRKDRILATTEAIEKFVNENTIGWANAAARQGALTLVYTIDGLTDDPYVRETTGSLASWIDKLFSARKHQAFGVTGANRVKSFG